MQPGINTPEYWIESFKPSGDDFDRLVESVISAGRPLSLSVLSQHVVRHRVMAVVEARQRLKKVTGTVYQPADRYEVGQKLVFPALEGATGVVGAVREGNNPAYGKYAVIGVDFGASRREFASGLTWDHPLGRDDADLDPDVLVERYAPVVAPQLAVRLGKDADWVALGERWFLRSLLPAVNDGHRNLAEAIIMLAGEPLPVETLLRDVDLDDAVPLETRMFALELAMAGDARFRNVGAIESPLWALTAPA